MSDQKKFDYLGTLLLILITPICVSVFYITKGKSGWVAELLHDLMPHLLGPILIILMIYYLFTKRDINFFVPEKSNVDRGISTTPSESSHEALGIELISHTDNAKVERRTLIHGRYKSLPQNLRLRIYVANDNQSACWVSTQNVDVNAKNKTWQSNIYIGNEKSNGKTFYIIVAVEENITDQWLTFYKSISEQHQDWQSLKYPLHTSIVETNKIKVIRI